MEKMSAATLMVDELIIHLIHYSIGSIPIDSLHYCLQVQKRGPQFWIMTVLLSFNGSHVHWSDNCPNLEKNSLKAFPYWNFSGSFILHHLSLCSLVTWSTAFSCYPQCSQSSLLQSARMCYFLLSCFLAKRAPARHQSFQDVSITLLIISQQAPTLRLHPRRGLARHLSNKPDPVHLGHLSCLFWRKQNDQNQN